MMIRIRLNGNEITVPEGSKIGEILKSYGISHDPYCLLAVVRSRKLSQVPTDRYIIKTNKGKIMIKVDDNSLWEKIRENIIGLKVAWKTRNSLSIGPFSLNLSCLNKLYQYEQNKIILSIVEGNGYLIFTLNKARIEHCTLNAGIVGRVITGSDILGILDVDDFIEEVEPVLERGYISGDIRRASLMDEVIDGDEIYSEIEIDLNTELPWTCEHTLITLEQNNSLDEVSETFARISGAMKAWQIEENSGKRVRGAVTVRTSGKREGDIYIYKRECMPSKNHSVIGFVKYGLELLEVAERGDKIHIVLNPRRINLIGLTQVQAGNLLEKLNIRHVRDGDKSDDAVVVLQYPKTTSEILKKKEVVTYGIDQSKIVKIKLFNDRAPKTSLYFRAAAELFGKRVGILKVFFKTDDSVIFKPDISYKDPLVPENIPKDSVRPGEIGVTNMSRKYAGIIGIRFTESKEFGPTGEPFESTNIVGTVTDNLGALMNSKEGEEVYLMEVDENES
jgi:putative methanogenesis marker protein 3